jgi:Protein of unknown function (DUF3592)
MPIIFQRLAFSVIVLFFVAITCFSYFHAWKYGVDIFKAYVTSNYWDRTPAIIDSSYVLKGCGKGGSSFYLVVSYKYEINNVQYASNRVGFGNGYCSGMRGAHELAGRYPEKAQMIAYVNPSKPSESVLVKGTVAHGTVFLFLLFMVIPTAFLMPF